MKRQFSMSVILAKAGTHEGFFNAFRSLDGGLQGCHQGPVEPRELQSGLWLLGRGAGQTHSVDDVSFQTRR